MDEGYPIRSGLTWEYFNVVKVSPGGSLCASRHEEDVLASPLAQSAKSANKFNLITTGWV